MTRGRPPLKRRAAAHWLARQAWFAHWTTMPSYRQHRREWKFIADAVKRAGLFSARTGTIDVPVLKIIREAIALRDKTPAVA